MTSNIQRLFVITSPVKVVFTDDVMSSQLGPKVRERHTLREYNLLNGDSIFLNESGGANNGVSIYFCLKEAQTNRLVLVLDQRKRVPATYSTENYANLFVEEDVDVVPEFLKHEAIVAYGIIFNMYEWFHDSRLPGNDYKFIVSASQYSDYYGCLAIHPAAMPCFDINTCSVSQIRLLQLKFDITRMSHERQQEMVCISKVEQDEEIEAFVISNRPYASLAVFQDRMCDNCITVTDISLLSDAMHRVY